MQHPSKKEAATTTLIKALLLLLILRVCGWNWCSADFPSHSLEHYEAKGAFPWWFPPFSSLLYLRLNEGEEEKKTILPLELLRQMKFLLHGKANSKGRLIDYCEEEIWQLSESFERFWCYRTFFLHQVSHSVQFRKGIFLSTRLVFMGATSPQSLIHSLALLNQDEFPLSAPLLTGIFQFVFDKGTLISGLHPFPLRNRRIIVSGSRCSQIEKGGNSCERGIKLMTTTKRVMRNIWSKS